MNKTFTYTPDKYTYRVEWSAEDNSHVARCLEFPSLATHGDTANAALLEIENVVAASIGWLVADKQKLPEPFGLKKYRGNLSLRIPEELHRQLAIRSSEEGVSINQYILSKVS